MLSMVWPRTSRPLGMNFKLSGLGVVSVWMKMVRYCCCCCCCWNAVRGLPVKRGRGIEAVLLLLPGLYNGHDDERINDDDDAAL